MVNLDNSSKGEISNVPEYSMLNLNLFRIFKLFSIVISLLVIVIGILGVIGWYTKNSYLFALQGNWAEMKLNAAIGLFLAGLSLLLIIYNRILFARMMAILGLVIALLTTLEYLLGIDFGIDQLLIHDWTEDITHFLPGRMALATSFSLLLLNLSLLVFSLKKKYEDQIILLTFPILMISSFYFFAGIKSGNLYVHISHPMAMQNAVCLFLLVVAIYLVGPLRDQFLVIANDRSSGFVARLLLPSAFIVPPTVVLVSLWGKNLGLYDAASQLGVIVMLSTGVCFLFSWVVIDILHRMDLREEQVNGLLRASNKELESFSYSISHDLQAPLRSISSFSEFLYEDAHGNLNEKSKDYLNRIISATERMGNLIDGILLLSKIGSKEMKKELINLSDMATMIIDELTEAEPQRSVKVNITPSIFARGDRALLMILMQNLLNNAWKYTKNNENAKIEFGIIQKANQIVYFVADNGAGFDSKYSDKLFTPFIRFHSKEEFEGTGIGLATVQRIINRHGGEIWAQAEINKGATFYFSLGSTD